VAADCQILHAVEGQRAALVPSCSADVLRSSEASVAAAVAADAASVGSAAVLALDVTEPAAVAPVGRIASLAGRR